MRVPSLVLFSSVVAAFAACVHPDGGQNAQRQGICDPAHLPAPDHEARTAVHESGHVLAAWVLGCAIVDRVTIIEDDANYGHTYFLLDLCDEHQDAVISLAGVAAKDLVYGPNPANAAGGSGDAKAALDDALAFAERSGAPPEARKAAAERLLGLWRTEAYGLLESHRCTLVAIADKLREEKNIGGFDLMPYLFVLDR